MTFNSRPFNDPQVQFAGFYRIKTISRTLQALKKEKKSSSNNKDIKKIII